MKLEKEIIDLILISVETAKLLGLEELIIDKHGIRGLHPDRQSLLLHKIELPLPFNAIGINRLHTLKGRLNIIKGMDNVSLNADISDNIVRKLYFSTKKLKVEYRCSNPKNIETPKNINENFFREVEFTEEAYMMLMKAQSVMKVIDFTMISDKDGVRFELFDENNDVFSYNFTNNIELLSEKGDNTFVFRYPIKVFLPILKQNPNTKIQIGEHGVLQLNINELTSMIVPKT